MTAVSLGGEPVETGGVAGLTDGVAGLADGAAGAVDGADGASVSFGVGSVERDGVAGLVDSVAVPADEVPGVTVSLGGEPVDTDGFDGPSVVFHTSVVVLGTAVEVVVALEAGNPASVAPAGERSVELVVSEIEVLVGAEVVVNSTVVLVVVSLQISLAASKAAEFWQLACTFSIHSENCSQKDVVFPE